MHLTPKESGPLFANILQVQGSKKVLLSKKEKFTATNQKLTCTALPSGQLELVVDLSTFQASDSAFTHELSKYLIQEFGSNQLKTVTPNLLISRAEKSTYDVQDWRDYFSDSRDRTLMIPFINGKTVEIRFKSESLNEQGFKLSGTATLSLKKLGFKSPKLAGGLVASVDDEVFVSCEVCLTLGQ